MKAKLTQTFIKNIVPGERSFEIHDTDLPGFSVRVAPSGAKTYNVFYRHHGSRKKLRHRLGPAHSLTITQAREAAKQFLGSVALGNDPGAARREGKGATLEGFLSEVYEPWAVENLKTGTEIVRALRSTYSGMLRKNINSISAHDVEKWRTKQHKSGMSTSSTNRYITYLSAMFTRAVEWGFLDAHPLKGKVKKAREDTSHIRFLSPNELDRLFKALDAREDRIRKERHTANQWREERGRELLPALSDCMFADHLKPMVLLSLNTGLRRGELLKLEWTDIDLERATLRVRPENAKSGKGRHVGLNKTVLEALHGWRDVKMGERLVFPGKGGKPFGHVNTAWRGVLKGAKIKNFRWHDMRHHFASMLVQKGVDLYVVKELLGHSSIAITERYAHLRKDAVLNAVNLLDE